MPASVGCECGVVNGGRGRVRDGLAKEVKLFGVDVAERFAHFGDLSNLRKQKKREDERCPACLSDSTLEFPRIKTAITATSSINSSNTRR